MTDLQLISLEDLAKIDKDSVRRRDLLMIRPEIISIDPTFNARGVGMSSDEYWQQEHVKEHVLNLSYAYEAGEWVPPLVVVFDPNTQKAIIRDGHHRFKGLMLAKERGAGIEFVYVTEFKGDEVKQNLLMLSSSSSLVLTPVEKAEIYHRFYAWGKNVQEIADMVKKTAAHVYMMLKVHDLPIEKKKLIQQGKLSVNAALADKSKPKKYTPPKKAVNEILDIVASADIDGEFVKVQIPTHLYKQLFNPELVNFDN
ncbi:hypothetical protein [Xenorhabdus nematophila]|uniref:hypothetical protein n=1 Tax=Xenorhabdus nematophila TaxID=628 RepID=UPI0030DD006A